VREPDGTLRFHPASLDHMDWAADEDLPQLARRDTVATLLPGANFFLGLDRYPPARRLIDDLPLFAAARPAVAAPQRDTALAALVEALNALRPDEMSPRDALEALYALKAQLAKPKKD